MGCAFACHLPSITECQFTGPVQARIQLYEFHLFLGGVNGTIPASVCRVNWLDSVDIKFLNSVLADNWFVFVGIGKLVFAVTYAFR